MADRASSRPGLPPWRAVLRSSAANARPPLHRLHQPPFIKVEKSIEQTGGAASFLDGIGQEEACGAQSTEANVGA
jgi:hypothetical protein